MNGTATRISTGALLTITLLLASGETIAATWEASTLFKDLSGAAGWTAAQNPRLLGDVNGDKKADIVAFGNDGVYLALANGKGFSTPKKVLSAYAINAGGWRVDRHPRMLGDVNGDKRADIIGFANSGVYISLSTGSGFAAPKLAVEAFGYSSGWRVDRHPRLIADTNGDNRADIIGFANSGSYVSVSTGSGFTKPVKISETFGYNNGWRVNRHPRFMADVNGDGRDDLVGFANAGVYLAMNNGKGSFNKEQKVLDTYGYSAGGWRVEKNPRFMADVNGDRKADIVGFANAGVYVSFSTGTGFVAPRKMVDSYAYSAGGWRVEKNPRLMADVNGDGKADIIGFGNASAYASLSTGSAFTPPELIVNDMAYNLGWRVGIHDRLVADVTGNGRADIVGFGPESTNQVASITSTESNRRTLSEPTVQISLPVRIVSTVPSRQLSLERGGKSAAVRIQGLNLSDISARVTLSGGTTTQLGARVVSTLNEQADIQLQALPTAPIGTYALHIRKEGQSDTTVPLNIEVVVPDDFSQAIGATAGTASTLPRAALGQFPPIDGWTKETGAASGSIIEFRSSAGFDSAGLPALSKLEIRLGDVPLTILTREPTTVRARIPYAPLPATTATLPLSASYIGIANSSRILDSFYNLDPALYDLRQARITRITPSSNYTLDNLPFSTKFTLTLTIADYPAPRLELDDVFLIKPRGEPTDCLAISKPSVSIGYDRRPDGTVELQLPVYSLGNCRAPYDMERPLFRVSGVPSSRTDIALGAGPTRQLFVYVNQPTRFNTRTPRQLTVGSTWALRAIFAPDSGSQFGTCSGSVDGQPVGVHEFGGDLAFSVRSGALGTECTFFTRRIRSDEGIRFGSIRSLPVATPQVTAGAVSIVETLGGDSCDTPLSGNEEPLVGGLVSYNFDRVAPDALPPGTDKLGHLRLNDEFPVLAIHLRCKAPIEGGSFSTSDFKLVRIETVTFSVDPELNVDESNIANRLRRVCYEGNRTNVDCVPPFPADDN